VSGPWFRRYFFSFKATTWQGWLVIALMVAVGLPCLLLSNQFERSWPLVSWILGALGFLIFVAGFALVWWKMDWDYGRR
jgi:hypothetical protein